MSAFSDITDEVDDSVELSENVADDFLTYFRGNVVGHEEEGWLMYLGALSGYGRGGSFHINTLGKGEPGSGKSLTKNTIEELLLDKDTYTKTDASPNALLDSVEWDLALVAPLDEYDKIDNAIVEVLKSSNPEDGGYSKDRNVEDPDAAGGYSPTEVSAAQNPWIVLYAPSSKKGSVNAELSDRALILYFTNDRNTRRSIGRKEFGHEEIDSSKYENQYIYDAHDTARALREHIRGLQTQANYETDDDGEPYMESRSGDTGAYIPKWVWYAVEPIFSIDEDHTNRVYGIVSNLIKSSAIANHHSRQTREVEAYVGEDSDETETRTQYVATPQDVWNVVMCLPTLLSTTHQLTPLKRHILDAVDATEPLTQDTGTTVSKVQEWLENNDIPHPARSTLKQRMDDLSEEYYLQRWKSTAGPKGQADAYEKHDDGALQPPRVTNLSTHANADGVVLDEDCVECDVDDPFADVWDPIRDQSALETQDEFAVMFSSESQTDDTVSELTDAMHGGDDTERPDPPDPREEGGDSSLGDFDGGNPDEEGGSGGSNPTPDGDTSGSTTVSLHPSDTPDLPLHQYMLESLQETDGEVFATSQSIAHYVGAVAPDDSISTADTDGTLIDPDHDIWSSPQFADDRVITSEDAQHELREAFHDLQESEWVALDDEAAPPAMEQLVIADSD